MSTINPTERKHIIDTMVSLAGAELGKYSRAALAPIPAAHLGRTTPAGYKMILSPESDKIKLPGLEILIDKNPDLTPKFRNIQQRSLIPSWKCFLIFHEPSQFTETAVNEIAINFKVDPDKIITLPGLGNIPTQVQLPIIFTQF